MRGRITQNLDPKRPVVMLFDGDLKEAKAQTARSKQPASTS